MNAPIFQIQHLQHHYGPVPALRVEALEIQPASIVGLVGPVLLVCQSAASGADYFNIDLGDYYPGLPSSYGAAASQPGTWNDITKYGTASGLRNTSGALTDVSLFWTQSSSKDGREVLPTTRSS